MDFQDLDEYTLPVLYYDVLSSHARSCQMLIKLLNIDVDLQLTDSMDVVDFNDTYTWINSFCRLPTLLDGNVTLCNGHSILIYLCQKYASENLPNLCPCDYITRQKVASLLYYEGCVLNRYLSNLLTDIFLLKYPNIDVEYHKRKVSNAYKSLNSFLHEHSFMIGSRLTIADIAIISAASALNLIFPINHDKFPKLFEWFQRLKNMDFYKCNDEGIQKLSYILKNVSKFHFPSILDNEQENTQLDFETVNVRIKQIRKNDNKSDFEEPITSTSKRMENISRLKSLKEEPDFPGYKNDGVYSDSDKFSFYDTYFINLSKCNCCAGAQSKESYSQIKEIFKRPETCGHLRSLEKNVRKLECQTHQNPSAKMMLTCRCNTQSGNTKTKEVIKIKSKKAEKNSSKNSKGESTAIDSYIMETESNNYSSASNPEDNDNETLGQSQQIKTIIRQHSTDKPRDKHVEKANVLKVGKETSEPTRVLPRTIEQESIESANQSTNQEVQHLLEKVRKYEKILENSDKVLKNKKPIPTKTMSDTSSIDSLTKQRNSKQILPLKCDVPNCSCRQKYHQCDCHKKHKRISSKVEALQVNKAVPIVLPKFLIAKAETEIENCKSTIQFETGQRLQAGTNPGLIINSNYENENSDDNISQGSEKIAKIIELLCSKNNKSRNRCRCVDCCRKGSTTESKIPRLVSYGSLVNGKLCKVSHLLGENFISQNQQSLRNMERDD